LKGTGRQIRYAIPMLCLGVVSVFCNSETFSQQVDRFAIARKSNHQSGFYSFDGNGRLKTSLMQTIANTNVLFFEDEVIQLEIELIDDQKVKFKSILKKWQDDWEATIKKIQTDSREGQLTREEVQDRIAETDELWLAKVRDVLMPHQLAIINELQLRCLFRTQGMTTILKSGELKELLDLSESDCSKILKAAKGTRVQVSKKSLEVRAKTLKILLDSLSKDDAEAFAKKWRHLLEDERRCSLEELIIFLDPQRYQWIATNQEPIEKLVGRPNFETGAAGNLEEQRVCKLDWSFARRTVSSQ